MKLKNIITMSLAVVMAVSTINMSVFAVNASATPAVAPNTAQMFSTEVDYISVDDYMDKYGRDNIIIGFNEAEAKHDAILNGTAVMISGENKDSVLDSEPNDLFLSLEEGTFLGLDIVGVSDLPPNDPSFSVKIKDNGFSANHNTPIFTEDSLAVRSSVARSTNRKKSYKNYDVYYSDNEPNNSTDLLNGSYEPLSGSYIYKYSYAFDNNYLCSTQVEFLNTELKCGTQSNNMYTYIAAKSNKQTLDFGLMANPAASNRNQGMYAFYNAGDGQFDVEVHPKVKIKNNSTNPMLLEDKTIEIRLSIGNGTAEMYMESEGSCIYYKKITMSSLISGGSTPLTFIQAMSCVEKTDGVNTSLTSGSYFKNVRFNNSKLYSYDSNSARSFSTYGPYTYYLFAAQPTKIGFSYGDSYESISINYN